ncbi:MAG: tRNA uridine-5-carboxymethylaminomethyl(34) synthesis enzyme MnmG [Puniceicoccales bacterium]|jgi:tRNA uridine 5-carboxymethylaminomethyl modification enzyme|nr:tRNA uridine-5-carboxymethylaminomethyl(34) synthesis enzyme MnmG [Puniceicoccales bacterium]
MFCGRNFDVIVVGAGHAGCEAAAIAAKLRCDTLLITGNLDTIAKMSCNPSIGGVAKGNIVREIDALGGQMAINADVSAIQFRMLNASKGAAVQGPRAQCDKFKYQERMKLILEHIGGNLSLFQGEVVDLILESDAAAGVKVNLGVCFRSKAIVLTGGTFLRGLICVGESKIIGGRLGDFAAYSLSENLQKYGIALGRMKTGTPPRILGSSIDFSRCDEQKGDGDPCLFGFYDTRPDGFVPQFASQLFLAIRGGQNSSDLSNLQRSCWIDHTNASTKEVVEANIHRSPLYSGEITGIGPRYCPSIEDKYVRFADRDQHRLFLEPEGSDGDEWYVNGLSTSLPFDVQVDILRSVPSLRQARIMRPGYAVEYDYAPPTQIFPTLESKIIKNLFFAGQINGTSGYEEAAGQGLIAGINAARNSMGKSALTLDRYGSYIGVLIDDLVTKGTSEPYRMFTSRAEHRLLLNHGSADVRLLAIARDFGLLEGDRVARIERKLERINFWVNELESARIGEHSVADCLRQNFGKISRGILPEKFLCESQRVIDEVLYRVTYAGYIEREQRQIAKLRDMDSVKIPSNFCYDDVRNLKAESRQKLKQFRPITLGMAARISGISPVDIGTIWVYIEKFRKI